MFTKRLTILLKKYTIQVGDRIPALSRADQCSLCSYLLFGQAVSIQIRPLSLRILCLSILYFLQAHAELFHEAS